MQFAAHRLSKHCTSHSWHQDGRTFESSGAEIGEGLIGLAGKKLPDQRVSCGGEVMIKEHDCVVLTKNLLEESLEAGDVGTVVHIHKGGAGYEVECATLTGETVAIVTVLADQVRPLNRRDIAHTRELQTA
jgi:hypothetical protein